MRDAASAGRGPGWRAGAVVAAAWVLLVLLPLVPVLSDADAVLRFNDNSLAFALSPATRLPAALLRCWDHQAFFGIGHRQVSVNVFTLLDAALGPRAFRRWGPAAMLPLVAAAVAWMLRGFGLRRRACVFAATALMLSGASFSYAVSGLGIRPLALGFNALAIGFIERGRRRGGWLPYVIAGGCVGCGIAEVPDVGAFLALTTAGVLAWTHLAARPVRAALPRAAAALLVTAVAAVPPAWQMITAMVRTQMQDRAPTVADGRRDAYDWATQWSIPPAETWNLVAGTYHGSRIDSASSPYWGAMGRTPGWERTGQGFRNFSLTGWYLGAVPAALLLALVLGWRRRAAGGAGAAPNTGPPVAMVLAGLGLTLALAWGRHTPLYRLVYAVPGLSGIRNPEKWMIPFALLAAMGVGLSLDRILGALRHADGEEARPVAAGARAAFVLAALAAVVGLVTVFGREAFLEARAADGFDARLAQAAWRHAARVCAAAAVVLAAAGGLLRLGRPAARRLGPSTVFAGLMALALVDLLAAGGRFVAATPARMVTDPNPLTEYLDGQRGEGRVRLLPVADPPWLGPVLNQFRLTFLMAHGADLFDPVSVERMPRDAERFLDALAGQPVRLWKLGALRFFLTGPGAVSALDAADGGRGRFRDVLALGVVDDGGFAVPTREAPARERVLRLVAFDGALPLVRPVSRLHRVDPGDAGEREALRLLASPAFDPGEAAILHASVETPFAAAPLPGTVRELETRPARWTARLDPADGEVFLVRAVRFDPDWRVTVDGVRVPLHRVNVLFQGVRVPAGGREVTWEYRPSRVPLAVASVARLVLLALVPIGLRRRDHRRVRRT